MNDENQRSGYSEQKRTYEYPLRLGSITRVGPIANAGDRIPAQHRALPGHQHTTITGERERYPTNGATHSLPAQTDHHVDLGNLCALRRARKACDLKFFSGRVS